MGKNRSASGLTNVIQYDNNGNITFVSGSTTLMQVSSSGAITTTGVISGSNALSASYALNSALLNGTGSVGFATTASLLTVSSSQQQISASLLQVSASYISLSGSYNTFSGSASSRITENSSSIQQVSSSQQQISASLLNVISIFATTGSNSFRATQSITGSLTVTGQIIAQTLNVQQVTSSIIYSSGSNNFGCDLNSRQTFTGSVLITGSCHAIFGNVGIGTVNPIATLTIKSSGATGVFLSCDTTNAGASSRLFFESCQNQFSVLNNAGKLQFNYAASAPSTSGTLGMVMDSCGNFLVGTGTAAGTEKLGVTRDDGVGNGLHVIADFNRSLGSSSELILGYFATGSTVTGPVVYSANGFPLLFSAGSVERMRINSGGCVGIGATSPCSLLNVNCVSAGGDSLYTNMFTITTDASSVYNHLALSPTSIEYRRETSTGVDLCIRTLVCNGSSGGNIVFAPNLDATSYCSYPRMKIQQNGFIGIGAVCAQTYIHVCDNLSAGRDDLIRLQTNISTNHAWLKSISCAGVTSIFGSNRANTDGALISNTAVAGTTSAHNFDLISNNTVRLRLSSGGAICILGNSSDLPTLFLAGPNYTMVAIGDRSSSSASDIGYMSVYNQGTRVIDLPGNADPITFNNGGSMIAGRIYACGDSKFGYQFLEVCNGETFHGPLSMGNSGGGQALTPLYCGGGKRWGIGWGTGDMNNMTNYNNCTPFLMNWGINGDNPTTDRKFCFNYSGNAYSTGGTWGTLSSNCIIKDCITAANSQWNDIKNICIVNYKMRDEITEFGDAARIHLGVIAEQIAQVSPGLLEDGGYNEKWCACLNGVKTSILHMKAVKALQEAMCRIELLESCLGIS